MYDPGKLLLAVKVRSLSLFISELCKKLSYRLLIVNKLYSTLKLIHVSFLGEKVVDARRKV